MVVMAVVFAVGNGGGDDAGDHHVGVDNRTIADSVAGIVVVGGLSSELL